MGFSDWGAALKEAGNEASDGAKAAQLCAAADSASFAERVAGLGKHVIAAEVLHLEAVAAVGLVATYMVASKSAKIAVFAFKKIKERFSWSQHVDRPCIPCLAKDSAAARAKRIHMRNSLIDNAQKVADPSVQARAARLKADMVAVEMARLSENTYAQSYDHNDKHPRQAQSAEDPTRPPEPWKAMTDDQLIAKGIKPALLRASKAILYTLDPSNFPFEPKTVLAFRGTTSETKDILADHDQAVGVENAQYTAAAILGRLVAKKFPSALVTGHSLGGGKAQAAGIVGRLRGMMFNSAGLHPNAFPNMTEAALQRKSDQFLQYRASGDPLTGVQNSLTAQRMLYGIADVLGRGLGIDAWARNDLGIPSWTKSVPTKRRELASELLDRLLNVTSEKAELNYQKISGRKWYIPPALGEIRTLTSKNPDGTDTSAGLEQHGIPNLVNGFEYRKFRDITDLLKSTNTNGNAADYLGPTQFVMH